MDVIGAFLLADYGAAHPKALPALRAMHALISQANWTSRGEVEKTCGAIARFENGGRVILELSDIGCTVALSVHYGLGVVRILAITQSVEVRDT